MAVLAAIGRFFKKIWDWIKQTAWIQPLLIVGIIFGVIFSIQPIREAIENAQQERDSAETYFYKSGRYYSLSKGANSDADKLTSKISQKMADSTANVNVGADKFFIAFVNKKGTADDLKDGFAVLEENMNKNNEYYKTIDDKPFKLITIFTDDVTSDTTDKESAFSQYLERQHEFFELAGSRIETTDYYNKAKKLDESRVEEFSLAEESAFSSPVILLVEMTLPDEIVGRDGYHAGVTEMMFGIEGSDKFKKAETLLHCWNHSHEFNKNDKTN